jgi:hypothetical protein
MKKIFYFCNVKNKVRYEAAATKQRFLYRLSRFIKRIEWASGNAPKGSALCTLTTRNTLILFNV